MRDEFQLDPDVAFLNHGSFGACPREVHDEFARLHRRLESEPVRFIQRELPDLHSAARCRLANYLGANDDEVVFVPNPTFAVNEIARSMELASGDEVLATNHEYGACNNAWKFMSRKLGYEVVRQELPLSLKSNEEFVETLWSGVSEKTRVIYVSHITSPTAVTWPVADICQRAREQGIITLVDGAHGPGQLPLDMKQIGADFYVGACHKWLCASKGSSFFYARREMQQHIEPLIVGWGWGSDRTQFRTGSDFVDFHTWLGTHNPCAYLTVPTAIEFQESRDWNTVRRSCHELAAKLLEQATCELPDVSRVHDDAFFQQMALLEITRPVDEPDLHIRLYENHRVEVPVIRWDDRHFVRASIQAYNTIEDVERLVGALKVELSAQG